MGIESATRSVRYVVTISKISAAKILFAIVIVAADSGFTAHYNHASSFTCLQPQPRAVRILDEVRINVMGRRFIPRMTVLHKCDSGSGCCLDGDPRFECGPDEMHDVKLVFSVIYTVNSSTHIKGEKGLETLTFKNHTKCRCMKPDERIKVNTQPLRQTGQTTAGDQLFIYFFRSKFVTYFINLIVQAYVLCFFLLLKLFCAVLGEFKNFLNIIFLSKKLNLFLQCTFIQFIGLIIFICNLMFCT